ncbi:hypothetical protein DMN91_004563 [Ooceraea biroi]|uniref:Methyltransferase type 12 domain-containing protein n=1 Tax=Ooceraea biroi TaxID=2015173 RepID=A0A3L8DPC5_OOCBI|nr:juvenile hormone acid O-methyltransferase-like [Ooceraea biroi]RLU22285.1 hypothetical protein DMN91_004563 [Ooceraea biroi]
MDMVDEYVDASSMQHRDAQDVLEEFSYELSKMRGRCIDIGCGPGDITEEMLRMLPHDAKVVGADISQTMVNYARQKHSDEKRLSYVVLDIETSELPSDQVEQYDNAVSFYCLHWCNDLWRAFQNTYKLLRPNGKALVMFLGYHFGFKAYLQLKQNPRYQPYLQDACRYVPYFQRFKCKDARASLRKMLEDIGFDVLHCSKREKSFKYSKQSLKNHMVAVNPFIPRMPDEIKNEFIDMLLREVIANGDTVMSKNASISLEDEQSEHIVLRYYLLIAYVQKPQLIS